MGGALLAIVHALLAFLDRRLNLLAHVFDLTDHAQGLLPKFLKVVLGYWDRTLQRLSAFATKMDHVFGMTHGTLATAP